MRKRRLQRVDRLLVDRNDPKIECRNIVFPRKRRHRAITGARYFMQTQRRKSSFKRSERQALIGRIHRPQKSLTVSDCNPAICIVLVAHYTSSQFLPHRKDIDIVRSWPNPAVRPSIAGCQVKNPAAATGLPGTAHHCHHECRLSDIATSKQLHLSSRTRDSSANHKDPIAPRGQK